MLPIPRPASIALGESGGNLWPQLVARALSGEYLDMGYGGSLHEAVCFTGPGILDVVVHCGGTKAPADVSVRLWDSVGLSCVYGQAA